MSPGHSLVDWEMAETHRLPVLNMLDDSGCVNDLCGEQFQVSAPIFLYIYVYILCASARLILANTATNL